MNLFILFGQTATGKTKKALELVEKHDGELVNFDSRQIYKKLNIVTGKDIPKHSKFVHRAMRDISDKYSVGYYALRTSPYPLYPELLWLYDIVDPKNTFSSAEYVDCAKLVIRDILARGKTPILVGGTGYYLRHLLFGVPKIKIQEDWGLRKELETKSVSELQAMLTEKNQAFLLSMNNSDRNNPRRLIRRIEIATQGGSLPALLMSSPEKETLSARLDNCVSYQRDLTITYLPFFHASIDTARERITERVEQRVENGALDEVRSLLREGYTKNDPGLSATGYKQLIGYLNKELTLSEAKKQWITSEIQYAKRQKTYFNKYFPLGKV